jgi:DMSO/TMAO reductase YedYZ molybdopterin-dependent catalytic subunit
MLLAWQYRNIFIYISLSSQPEGEGVTSEAKKPGWNKKILASIVVIIIIIAAASGAAVYFLSKSSGTVNLPTMSLTLVGANGQQKVLDEKDIVGLQSYTAKGGLKSSGGEIQNYGTYEGVPVTELLNSVGGITSDETLTVTGSDGYSMVYTYNQTVNGQGFTAYDPLTGSEKSPTKPLTLVLAYEINGSALTSDVGPLRLVILGPDGLLTEGHFWVKWVTTMAITSNVQDWNVSVIGTTTLVMTRQAFEAEVNHEGINYTDTSGNVWTGTTLSDWVSWCNINGGISNASLAAGYSVTVVGSSGASATFTGSQVANNTKIIVAVKLNNALLSPPYWPLTLVGADVSPQNQVEGITEIKIDSASWSIVINGTSAITYSQASFANAVMMNPASYNDGTTTWSGTPLSQLVTCAENKGAISSSALTDGYVVKVIGADGKTATFNNTRLESNNIIIADEANGGALPSNLTPLVLEGQGLANNEKIAQIQEIQVSPIQGSV